MANLCTRCSKSENDCECEPPQYALPEEYGTPYVDFLSGLYSAVMIAGEVNTYTREDDDAKRRIISRALRIADQIVGEFYEEFFPGED